jgi:HSP20 family molecular chaperone IbpA
MATSPYRGRGFYDPQSEVTRLVDEMFGSVGRTSERQQGAQPMQWVPALDVLHEDGDLLIRAELPGVKREDVEITLLERALTISGERRVEEQREGSGYYVRERRHGSYCVGPSFYLTTSRRGDKRPVRGRRPRGEGTGRGGGKGAQAHTDTRPEQRRRRHVNHREAEPVLRHSPPLTLSATRGGGAGGGRFYRLLVGPRKSGQRRAYPSALCLEGAAK